MMGGAGLPVLGRLRPVQLLNRLSVVDWEREHTPLSTHFTGRVDGTQVPATGYCASLDGINDEFNAGNDSSLQITGAHTVGLWFKTDDLDNNAIFSKWNHTGDQRGWLIEGKVTTQELNYRISSDGTSGGENVVTSPSAIYHNDVWTYVVGVFDPGVGQYLYVNGTLVASDTSSVPAAVHNSTANLLTGIRAGSSAYLPGEVAGAFVYAAAAAAADVAYAFNNAALPHQNPDSSLTATDLKGHWPYDEGFWDANFTTAFDHSGNGNHATNTSAGATAVAGEEQIPQTVEHGFTQADRFDGVNDDVTFTSSVADMRQDWTLAFLASIEDVAAIRCLLSWADAGGDGVQVAHDGSGGLYCRVDVSGGANQTVSSTHTFAAKDVAHVVVAHDVSERTLYFYVDGAAAGSDTYTGDLPNASATVGTIGDGADLGNAKGVITEVAQFSVLFDASDVTALYNSGDPLDARLHTQTADGYWRNGWTTSAGTWEDLSSNAAHGTMNGSPDTVLLTARHDDGARDALGGFVRQADQAAFAVTGSVELLGPPLVTNGDFASATGWTATSPWSITGGLATIDGSQAGNTDLTQSIAFVENDYYRVTFDVLRRAAGSVTVNVHGTAGTARSAAGGYEEIIQAGASGGLVLTANATFDGDVDNVTARVVRPDELFIGGGTIVFWLNVLSGGASQAQVWDKHRTRLYLDNESAGTCELRLQKSFSVANGRWSTTGRVITYGTPIFLGVTYDESSSDNDPQFYVDGAANTAVEVTTPNGSAFSDAGTASVLGKASQSDANYLGGDILRCYFYSGIKSASDMRRLFEVERGLFGV